MPTDNQDRRDRAEREIEELRQLFAASGRPRGSRRLEHALKAIDARTTQQAQDERDGQRALPGSGSGPMRSTEAAAERRAARLSDARAASIERRRDGAGNVHEPGQEREAQSASRPPSSPPTPRGSVAMSAVAPDGRAGRPDGNGRPPSSLERSALPGRLEPRPPKGALTRLAEADHSRSSDRHNAVASGGEQTRRRQRVLWVGIALALALVAFAAGLRLGQEQGDPQASTVRPSPVPDTTVPPPSAEGPQATTRACLDTARRGDAVIAMLIQNIHDRRLEDAMEAYDVASRQCRSAAIP
jgi:hypothetical protein